MSGYKSPAKVLEDLKRYPSDALFQKAVTTTYKYKFLIFRAPIKALAQEGSEFFDLWQKEFADTLEIIQSIRPEANVSCLTQTRAAGGTLVRLAAFLETARDVLHVRHARVEELIKDPQILKWYTDPVLLDRVYIMTPQCRQLLEWLGLYERCIPGSLMLKSSSTEDAHWIAWLLDMQKRFLSPQGVSKQLELVTARVARLRQEISEKENELQEQERTRDRLTVYESAFQDTLWAVLRTHAGLGKKSQAPSKQEPNE